MRPQLRRTLRFGLDRVALPIIGVAIVTLIWWAISLSTTAIRLPSPMLVAQTAWRDRDTVPALQYVALQSGGINAGVMYTAVNVLLATGSASLVGAILGITLGRSAALRQFLRPTMLLLGTIPILVGLPFLEQWFGTSRLLGAGLVAFFGFVTVAAVAEGATVNVDTHYRNFALSLGAGRMRELRTVVLPAVVPAVLNGVRISLAAGWGFECVAELIGGQHGAGRIIEMMGNLSDTQGMLAVVLVLGCLALLLDAVLVTVRKVVIRWQE
jgi:ABC-type nitrate/sulfonate/bicarbonate transport system permease component